MPTDPIPASRLPRARVRRLRRIGLAAALIVLLPVAALAIGALLLPTEMIARSAAQRAEAALGVPVAIGDLEVAFWPLPSVSLRDTRLGTETAPVARVERILLRPRLLPLLRGQVTVREIAIDRPDVWLVIDSAGALNLPFGAGDPEPGDEASNAEVDFAIDEFRVRDGRLSYVDARDGTEVVLSGLQQALRIEGRVEAGSLARVGLAGRLSGDSVDAVLPGRLAAPLRGVRFTIDHDAELDREADRLELTSLRIELQRVVLAGSGRLEAVSDSLRRRADLDLRAEEFSFEDLARSLPEGFLAALLTDATVDSAGSGSPPTNRPTETAYAGRAAIATRVAGPITRDSIPRVEGTVQLREVAVTRGGSAVVGGMGGTIGFSNDGVEGRQLAGHLFGAPFALEFTLIDLSAPVIDFATRGTARAEELLALAASDPSLRAAGGLPFDLRGRLQPDAPESAEVEGTIGLGGVGVELPSLLQPMQITSGIVRFSGGALRLEDIAIGFGESRVRAAATVEGWLDAALGDTSALPMVRFDAEAGTLDLDALLGPSESEYTPLLFARLADRPVNGRSAAEAAAELGLELPELPRIRAVGSLRAERLVRNGITYQDLELAVESSPEAVSAPRVLFGLMGGTVELGLALERAATEATLIAVYHLENVGAGEFFSRFTPFQGTLSGLMTLDGEASLQLDGQMLPVRPTVRSSGRLALTSGSLSSWPLLAEVGERLGLQSFDTLAFRDWSGDFLVAGPLVTLERSLQLSDRVETELAGSFDFGGQLDLGVIARLSPELVAGAGADVRAAATSLVGEGGSVPVGLRITGTAAAPKIALDLSAARDEALARARTRATEEAEGAARRAAAEIARRALGDSVPVDPAGVGAAVRSQVQDRIRGLFGRSTQPAPVAPGPEAPDSAPGGATQVDTTGPIIP